MNLISRITEPELMTNLKQVVGFDSAEREKSIESFLYVYRAMCDVTKKKIIDLGCGSGKFLIKFAQEFPHIVITGYDGSAEMVEIAKQNVKDAGLENRIEIKHSMFLDIPITECDCVISSGTLHHSHDPLEFWESIKRIVNDKTQIYIMDMLRPVDENKVIDIVNSLAKHENEYFKIDLYNSLKAAFTKQEIEKQLKQVSLTLKIVVTRHKQFGELVFLFRNVNE